MIKRLQHISCEERLRELVLFSLEKGLGRPYFMEVIFQYLKGAYEQEGGWFLLVLIAIGQGGMALN